MSPALLTAAALTLAAALTIKATVFSPQKVTVAEAYQAFLSILEANGLTVVPHGRFYKIIDECFQFSQIARGNPWTGPLERQSLHFNTQSVQLPHLFRTELGDKGSGVGDPSHETLPLQANQGLADDRCTHLHFLCHLAFDDRIAGFQLA